ncbi:MerR family DNA-binding transcriptional regulator [Methylorubrum extorquens]
MGITIRELSERSGVKVPTIRYYERQGLLPEPEKTGSGQRRYGSVDVARLRFVRFGRGLQLEANEVRALIEMIGEGDGEAIIVLAEAVVDRAERLRALSESLRSVSAAIIGGAIDEQGAFGLLVDGSTSTPFPGVVANGPIAGLVPAANDESSAAPTDEMSVDGTSSSVPPREGAIEASTAVLAEEGVAAKAPHPMPVRKRNRAKS